MNKRMLKNTAVAALVGLFLVTALACRKDAPQQDAFLQKWRAVADQSQGTSPVTEGVPLDVDDRNLKLPEGYADVNKMLEKPEVERPLPTMPVSLEMRRANITAVLAALAKAAGVSVMISPEVSGEVTVNVERKPWNEVFAGVLKTNGLAYSWEGDILRVKTLEDIERDVEITALRAKQMVQQIMLKKAEPPVTRIIRIRYNNAINMAALIEKIVFNREVTMKTEEETKDIKGDTSGEASVLRERSKEEITAKDAKQDDHIANNVPGYVHADPDSNSLIVQASPPYMKIIYYLVRKMDKPRKQIKIKAYIVELDTRTARELGVRWGGIEQYQHAGNKDKFVFMPGGSGGSVRAYNEAGGGPQTGEYNPYFGPGVSGQGWAANFPLTLTEAATRGAAFGFLFGTIGENVLEAQLLALAMDNKVKILSSPSLTTQDNKEALLKDGMEVPYVSGYDSQGNAVIAWKEAVLALRITPQIIDDINLHMQIQIKKDELDFTISNVQGLPVVRKKLAETELVSRSKETIVIGGLTKRRMESSNSGIPYLKDIPVLGWVFKQDLKDDEQQEILIFITPEILDYWTPDDIQKSFDQIDRELREDGIVLDGGNGSFIQGQ